MTLTLAAAPPEQAASVNTRVALEWRAELLLPIDHHLLHDVPHTVDPHQLPGTLAPLLSIAAKRLCGPTACCGWWPLSAPAAAAPAFPCVTELWAPRPGKALAVVLPGRHR